MTAGTKYHRVNVQRFAHWLAVEVQTSLDRDEYTRLLFLLSQGATEAVLDPGAVEDAVKQCKREISNKNDTVSLGPARAAVSV